MSGITSFRGKPQVDLVFLARVHRQKRIPVHVEVQTVSGPVRGSGCGHVFGGWRVAGGLAAAERLGQLSQTRVGIGSGRGSRCGRGGRKVSGHPGIRRDFRRRGFRRRVRRSRRHRHRFGRRGNGLGLIGGGRCHCRRRRRRACRRRRRRRACRRLLALDVVLVLFQQLLEFVGGKRVRRVGRLAQGPGRLLASGRFGQVRVDLLGVVVEEHLVAVEGFDAGARFGGLIDGLDGRRDVFELLQENVLRQRNGVVIVVGQQPYVLHDLRYPVDVHGLHVGIARVEHVIAFRYAVEERSDVGDVPVSGTGFGQNRFQQLFVHGLGDGCVVDPSLRLFGAQGLARFGRIE